jgi:hypothetical protein
MNPLAIAAIMTASAAVVTLAWNIRNNRRLSYVNTITAARLKWIGEVRTNLSRFVACIYQCVVAPPTDPTEYYKLIAEIAHLRMLLRLQMAPPDQAELDASFEDMIEETFRDADTKSVADVEIQLEKLVAKGQVFLWVEWRKAKEEAICGDPYDTLPNRYRVWMKRHGQ